MPLVGDHLEAALHAFDGDHHGRAIGVFLEHFIIMTISLIGTDDLVPGRER